MTQPSDNRQALTGRMQALLRVFEQMRERPRRRGDERLRPLLLITGPAAATRQVTQVLARRCGARDAEQDRVARRRVDPFARLDADVPDVDEVGALLRRISQELSEHHPRWEPALRFPLLSMALWLQQLRDDTEHADVHRQLNAGDRRRVMRRMIRQRRHVLVPGDRAGDNHAGRRDTVATVFTYLTQILPIGFPIVALLSVTAAGTLNLVSALVAAGIGLVFLIAQAAARTRDWAGRRRYEWFTGQPYLDGTAADDFLSFAIRAVAHQYDNDEVERLLAAAFLADLRNSYRRRRWRRTTWARVRYPVLLLNGVDESTEGYGLIRHIEKIRRETALTDPLIMVAAMESAAVADEIAGLARVTAKTEESVDPHGVETAWEHHQKDQSRFAALGPHTAIQVEITKGDAEMAGNADGFVGPPRPRPRWAHPTIPWLAMAAVLAGSLTWIGFQDGRYCDPYAVWHASNGECVGITDGSYVFHRRLEAVEKRIQELNEDVDEDRPYVTIIYLGAMSVDPKNANDSPDLLAGIHGELLGLSIEQNRHNKDTNSEPQLRILLANSGDKFQFAPEVAEKIRERSLRDRTIVAAVGFGHSKTKTQEAIEELGRTALPMIGTTITLDDAARQWDDAKKDWKGKFSPYFFRLAPPNQRLAQHAAYWARQGLLGGLEARTATVFYDSSSGELYSPNLKDGFVAAFKPGNAIEKPYETPGQIQALVDEACKNPTDLFYFAGRSDEFRKFHQELSTTPCNGRRTVLAGDEVTKYVTDDAENIAKNDALRLYYTPIAAKQAWDDAIMRAPEQPLSHFYRVYDDALKELTEGKPTTSKPALPSQTHAAVGYDAALTITTVTKRIYDDQRGRSLPTAAGVLAALTENINPATTNPENNAPNPENNAPQGASGLLLFGPRGDGHVVLDKPVLLVGVSTNGGKLQVEAVCGRLTPAAPTAQPSCPE